MLTSAKKFACDWVGCSFSTLSRFVAQGYSSPDLAPNCLEQLDGFYRFELHRRDEREIVKMLVDLSVREPGEVSVLSFQSCFHVAISITACFIIESSFIYSITNSSSLIFSRTGARKLTTTNLLSCP